MPVPEDADSPRFRTNIGTVHYAPEKSAIIWKIKQFGGGKEFLMRAELGLPSVKGDDEHGGGMTGGFGGSMGGTGQMGKSKRPINVKFEIPYFTTSGIQVRYLKITEPKVCLCLYSMRGRIVDGEKENGVANISIATISLPPLGALHHAVRRYRRPHAGRAIGVIYGLNPTCSHPACVIPNVQPFCCVSPLPPNVSLPSPFRFSHRLFLCAPIETGRSDR